MIGPISTILITATARWFVLIAKRVDIIAKGCVNFNGHKRNRAWVRRCVEQEVDAMGAVKRAEVFF